MLTTMTALAVTGSAPAPFTAPAPAQPAFERARGGDPDRICARYLNADPDEDLRSGRHGPPPVMAPLAPQPIPRVMPQSPQVQSPQVQSPQVQSMDMAVTGSRINRSATGAVRGMQAGGMEDRERYAGEEVAAVQAVADAPVSTFGVDVDTGSYANVRRFLAEGRMPPQAAVRTEELLNYFRYDYPAPQDRTRPFSITTDMTTTPWNPQTRLLRVGLRGYDVERRERPAANLVFLVDVSGSMMSRDKLPLVQCSLALLAEQMNPRDRVSIVVYAGAAGKVLDPTGDPRRVQDALGRLQAGGSTAGAEGIALAYQTARENRIEGGINRVILATDGDFNVGVSNTDALIDMVERERKSGTQLTTLGFGTGNFNEAMMEQIADHGNGNYAYIDSPREAQKVLTQELSSTLFTIAQDVKIQVEFNPAHVAEYRLIGYENRALREQDFANDAVDAGDIGAGHQVTALYEVVPVGSRGWLPQRRYDANRRVDAGGRGGELAHLRLRYKLPGQEQSRLIEQPLGAGLIRSAVAPAGDSAFAVAVAAYGQLLRGDTHLGTFSFADARALAGRARLTDWWRREFVQLAQAAERGGRRAER
jgi:Ca-activated chloride channel family protein